MVDIFLGPDVAAVQTTDATPRTLGTVSVSANSVVYIRVTIAAFRPSNGDSATYEIAASAKRISGNAALVGLVVIFGREDIGAASWNVGLSISGNDVLVGVTGQAAATINWTGKLETITAS